ncbi:MAG: 4Fe-4S dicluster domain-containing protein [Candidatus Stahlbacteria bacterium]|nr:MAG: 4Fe-4S dicluster domain-containing protein [Candidatus Stahlbacteria bacterium]
MTDEIYEQLADALDRLPNGFPRTPSNVEILLLKKMFSPEEASLACQLGGEMEGIDVIAERVGLPVKEARTRLLKMVKRGLVWFDKEEGRPCFRLAPFIVGSYEAQLEDMDHEFAHLFEEYMADGGAIGIMRPQPAIHRVVPAQSAVKSEWILPYDDVRKIILDSKTFRVQDCICRVQQDLLGNRKCDFPLKNCLGFSSLERPPRPDDISQEDALAILDKTEEIGLVHTVSNIAKGIYYVCNCCGCCCGILRGINDWGIEDSVAAANYYAVIDSDECTDCGICIERCQVSAISLKDEVAFVNREKCIGCGLCVTGCPTNAAKLHRKPDEEIIHPPEDFATWEQERLKSRGLSE